MSRFDHFTVIAPYYERLIKAKTSVTLLELLQLRAGQLVLDAAGGTGRIAANLSGAGCRIVVGDFSHGMLRQARVKGDLMLVRMLVEKLPFVGGIFDRIVMVDALHHVFDQHRAIDALVTGLKPGGKLVIEEPDIRSIWVKAIAAGEKLLRMRSNFLTSDQIENLFTGKNGEISVKRENTTLWVVFEKKQSMIY